MPYGKLDALVNNAGVALGSVLMADATTEDLRRMLDTNVMGVFYGMKYAIKEMLKAGGGAIVNLASIAGHNGLLYTAQYCASKHAVVGLTKGAAIEQFVKQNPIHENLAAMIRPISETGLPELVEQNLRKAMNPGETEQRVRKFGR